MGQLVEGEWTTGKLTGDDGAFKRSESSFRNWVTADGAPGPSGEGGFKAESGRYHLYVSLACPWAHRALVAREAKGLADHIDVSVVHPDMLEDGWTFDDSFPGATGDRLMGKRFLREIYVAAEPKATTRVTVPVLWDKQRETIVSNESAEIIRMFDQAFDGVSGEGPRLWPEDLREAIEPVNARIYDTLNNGVYKSGFATTQKAYEAAVVPLFETLDWLEDRLSSSRYLMGERITEADWRLYTTLARFDAVYFGHFKCNIRRLCDMPALWGYARELYQRPEARSTTDFAHIKRHYHYSHESINPHRIVPLGPELDWDAPHGRERLAAA
ncbi:glutathione S-transferase family protein [uncultured Albimonas sp.]|uniref:glutathione S-transferase family protein n=1 Tax=uncultured Albimonas sp. TaxID=1331701 RepID=UPI0030EBFD11|tara:strand:- start:2934 stop:3917 length:984 start_codon:yes stop_codon:yes gene_type:complete